MQTQILGQDLHFRCAFIRKEFFVFVSPSSMRSQIQYGLNANIFEDFPHAGLTLRAISLPALNVTSMAQCREDF